MYTVVEIDKTTSYHGEFTPCSPYVYQSTVSLASVATYWTTTFGADGTYTSESYNITSVLLNSIYDVASADTIADCQSQKNSFYFDFANQMLYIHYPHAWAPASVVELTGMAIGYCSDTVRYFRNQIYRPIVQSIPSLSDQADPLQYGIMAFGGGTVSLKNHDAIFDEDEELYGNLLRIKMGEEGDGYDDLILMFSGYIKDYTLTTSEFNLNVADKRERLQAETPTDEFNILEAYNDTDMAWETKEELLPDGYGDVIQVPAYPTAENATTVTYKWGTSVTSITKVYTYYDDVLHEVTHSDFSIDGTFELDITDVARDSADAKKGLKPVFVTGRMRDYDNPADIIADLNDRVNNVEYNSTNYNQTEWEDESADLDDISLYMDESKPVYEWIEEIQNGCNWGFRYEDTDKITLRRDDPDRTTAATIEPIDIRNSDIPIERNAELYASSCVVRYAKNWRTGRYSKVENTDYEDAVIDEHRVRKVQEYKSLLKNSTDADEKALRVMQDISEVRPIVTLRINAKTYSTPRIYDIIDATVSLLTQGHRIPDVWSYVLGDTWVLGDSTGVTGETYDLTFTEAYSYTDNVREYFGSLTGQVIGIQWIPESNEIELRLRSR